MKHFCSLSKLLFVIMLALIACSCAISKENDVVVRDFRLSDMQGYIDKSPWDENIGPITNAEEAVDKAKEIWIREYYIPWNKGNTWEEANGRPVDVYYDKTADCWYLTGTLEKNMLGGTPKLIVRSDGEVLALWHDQ